MRFRSLALLAIAVLLFVSACSKDDDSYRFPLKVGNSWTYEQVTTEMSVTDTVTVVDTIHVTIDSILVNNGDGVIPDHFGVDKLYRLRIDEQGNHGDPLTTYQYMANTQDGLSYYGSIGMGSGIYKGIAGNPVLHSGQKIQRDGDEEIDWFSEAHLIMPKDPKTGCSWIQPHNSDWMEVHYELLARENVQTPVGNISCYVKKTTVIEYPPNLFKTYYSSKGLIRQYISFTDEDMFGKPVNSIQDKRLIDYDLK